MNCQRIIIYDSLFDSFGQFFDTKSDLTAHTSVLNNKKSMMKSYVDWFISNKSIIFSNIDTSISPSDGG